MGVATNLVETNMFFLALAQSLCAFDINNNKKKKKLEIVISEQGVKNSDGKFDID